MDCEHDMSRVTFSVGHHLYSRQYHIIWELIDLSPVSTVRGGISSIMLFIL